MLNGPFSPWPVYSDDEIALVTEIMKSGKVNYWTGEQGKNFEKAFTAYTGVNYAVALANGTLALELALRILNIGEGDEVIVSPRSFFASASCIKMVGATPVFADVDPEFGNITAEAIRTKLTDKTKAVICVHLGGWPCKMDEIMQLATEHQFKVIEDCAQAHGTLYKSKHVGTWGHVGVFSFCQDKIISTCGEGGMLITDDEKLWQKAWSFKDHGKDYQKVYEKTEDNGFKWLHDSFGSNYRLTESQAAVGRLQLQKLNQWKSIRRKYTATIHETANSTGVFRVANDTKDMSVCPYKCYIYVDSERLSRGWSRDRVREEVVRLGVPCFTGSCSEIYKEKAFSDICKNETLENAMRLGLDSLCFLVHPTLTESEIEKTCHALLEVAKAATRQ